MHRSHVSSCALPVLLVLVMRALRTDAYLICSIATRGHVSDFYRQLGFFPCDVSSTVLCVALPDWRSSDT